MKIISWDLLFHQGTKLLRGFGNPLVFWECSALQAHRAISLNLPKQQGAFALWCQGWMQS